MDDTREISLSQLIGLMMKNKIPILLSCILGTLAAFAVTSIFMDEKYDSSVKLYVYTSTKEQQSSSQDLNDLTYAQRVVNTYIQMLDTRLFYKEVLAAVNLPYDEDGLRGMITFSALNSTEVFQATVVSPSPEDSMAIAQAIADIAPLTIGNVKENALLKIVDPPALNIEPVSPNLRLNLAIGLGAGLAGAAMFILLKEMLDIKIKSSDSLYDRHKIYVLAEVGDISKEARSRNKKNGRLAKADESEGLQVDSSYQEAYKMARTNLVFSVLKKGCRKLAIASSVSGEGKTTTCVNLAIAFAQQINSKVLLVDCDLRKPRLNRYFGLPNTPGLSDYLSGLSPFEDILRQTAMENLSLISAGTIPPNPSELLGSEAYESFLREVDEGYDFVIIDTSPLNVVTDALSVVRQADGVVLSSIQDLSNHTEFARTLEMIKNVDAKPVGAILHGVDERKGKKYGEYYYYYKK
jgi:capsular exopolysaccharide synthesis family protein